MGICKTIRSVLLSISVLISCFSFASPAFIYHDVNNQQTIDDIIKARNEFTALNTQAIVSPKLVSTWLKIDTSQLTKLTSPQVVYLEKPINSSVEFYHVNQGNLVNRVMITSDNAYNSRLQNILPHIKFYPTEPDTQLYIHLRAPYAVKFEYHIVTEQAFRALSQSKLFWYGIELGLLFFIALAFFVISVLVKRMHLALLASYITFLAIQCSINNGSIVFYLPIEIGETVAALNGSWLILACAMCLLYHQSYFSSIKDNRSLSYAIWAVAAGFVVIAAMSFAIQTSLSNQFQVLSCLLTAALLVTAYYYVWRESGSGLWLAGVTWAPMLLLGLAWVAMQVAMVSIEQMLVLSRLAIATHILLLIAKIFINDKKLKDQMIFYSLHDPDSGLPNRVALNQHLTRLANANKHHTLLLFKPLVLRSIRLNIGIEQSNKQLNELITQLCMQLDRYGLAALDSTAENKTDIFRLDDATFGITLMGKLSLSQIEQYVCILSAVFEEGVEYKATRLVDEIEVGVAHSPLHAKTAEGLIQSAMLALSTKSEQSDHWQIFDLANSVISERRMRISSAIKEAIDSDCFSLYLQPQANLTTGKVYGAECLLRWFHPQLGQIPPDEFIPIAESSGLIHSLTELVIEKGLKYQQHIIEQYPGHILSLNMSGKDLTKKELLVHLITLVNELNLNPSQIIIELTESVTIANENMLKSVLDDYRRVGVKLAIDDFGTGYSSLAYLSRLGFDELKIDKQFIMDIETSKSNQTIAKAMSDMAHSLGLKVVAEGVESIESYTRLEHYGCDYGQGYFISKPLPFDEYLRWLYEVNQSDDVKQYLIR
ncbi:hypothetical protein PA25_13500 [Pseudoalteromonas sp. A25]|uniref:EAL domain-containing protein n=1 Tax=Pseudoalteromonas sp. A25 TaxID=116092 RepID=UPI0012A1739B|nr:EAL domain-containing protein [Pseudoalteromonas sp. A25]BBN81365.1 hypothetical protein PA25_13500 [Pseudoalteromonas sp. A25]